ncbi:sphingosine hydroxylase [Moniliophthora roreri MCA 2997]|uniref:Sphingosine hydroxylase n=1 Tax=Moniliophthora roreri (strain MCA 2997) TaxID=1381753 RepID=V2YXG1_MONRO|nr:sphingosine hydroxylase [Moniliophthora roreri MCA 2997]
MNDTSSSCSLSSSGHTVCFTRSDAPLYYSYNDSLVNDIPDSTLTIASPVVAYWTLSLFYHFLDTRNWKWLDKYRIHESEEVTRKNRVTRWEVVKAVVFQHVLQTLLGWFWIDERYVERNHILRLHSLMKIIEPLVGGDPRVLHNSTYYLYWWGIPLAQLLFAMFIIDTWQYFLHRGMHLNPYLYRTLHSVHHRLYVPYAYGALYNHPVEGFVLDSLGAAIAEYLTGMTTRQALVLFTLSTFKTVDDHCGYRFPWDPLQMMSGNNADYHDIHHQVIGIKSNFAQPFFIHWDVLLGTRMTREELESRKRKRGKEE